MEWVWLQIYIIITAATVAYFCMCGTFPVPLKLQISTILFS